MAAVPARAELSELLCFDLYAASRAVTALYRPLLEPLGLTYPQYLVLVVLWERHSATVKQLGESLQLDYGTLTPLLRRLEAAGLVTRQRRLDDERSVTVALTPAGLAMRRRARRVPAAIFSGLGISGSQAAELQGTLRQLTAAARG